jgi:outer membrane protein assembly factor BamB
MVWKHAYPSKPHPKNGLNSYAASTPAVDKTQLYVTWASPDEYVLVAMDRETGKELWRRDFGPFAAEHGFGASPILYDDLVIVPNDQNSASSVIAVDRATGKTRWTTKRSSEKAAYSTPILYSPEGGRRQLILTSLAHGVSSLDPSNGAKNWELGVLGSRTVGSPIVAAGLIFAACGEGGGGKQMFAIQPGDSTKGIEAKVAYKVDAKLPYVVTPVAYGKLLFLWCDSGIVSCLDAPTGKTLWRQRLTGKFYGSPVRVQDRLYAIDRDGTVVVLAAADHYKLLGQVPLGEPSQSTPAVSGGVMYLRTQSQLMALGGK